MYSTLKRKTFVGISFKPKAMQFVSANGVPCAQKELSSSGIYHSKNEQNKNLLLTILKTSPTKRDAKVYLQRFAPLQIEPLPLLSASLRTPRPAEQDHFTFFHTNGGIDIALLKICEFDIQENSVLTGISHSIVQLRHLGLISIVIIEPSNSIYSNSSLNRMQRQNELSSLAEKVASAIEKQGGQTQTVTNGLYGMREDGSSFIENLAMLSGPLKRGQMPIITTSSEISRKSAEERTNDLLYALTELYSEKSREKTMEKFLVNKIFILNQDGGIPSHERGGSSHVFINLQQEFENIKTSLVEINTISSARHLKNLELVKKCLSLLPFTSSAIITTPKLATSNGHDSKTTPHPLIYNLLTDRPTFSSSLPIGAARTPKSTTSVIRHGVPIVKHLNLESSLRDSKIDLPRLLTLIEDSFARRLDLNHYKNRLEGKFASLIIAGDYEGCAITTYEKTNLGSKIPYLDKLAVLKSRQGSSCLADILFRSLTDTYPNEIFWRSRVDNPANKWYFERCKFSWKLPGSKWCLFWTGKLDYPDHITEYTRIVEQIEPSLM
ncbi:Amino-acid acetyltransferase, mitochondrial [Neolecta irregularis DAH-3]|uniref:Amino-acid acetyltransferase, mitochondrial n=1 Tax=Neolecta irregularis (strain DAH-3) TaxID=1198029 RepID=A0A1U7LVZ5_NEOID|nr:Amino-acid acetyltransferase, mitochondrial [Neolecta irregularis DAH-3]|eukprot:OLL26681.1 Amino-acid acetyltransferase, mitochondrial [Neolecta irregularis DAH-3]